jgi:hypothetical protein
MLLLLLVMELPRFRVNDIATSTYVLSISKVKIVSAEFYSSNKCKFFWTIFSFLLAIIFF